MKISSKLGALSALLALSGCAEIVAEPPPPPSKLEVVVAAPGALGARAAGTDMAPKPPGFPLGPSDEEEGGEAPNPDGGALSGPEKAVPL